MTARSRSARSRKAKRRQSIPAKARQSKRQPSKSTQPRQPERLRWADVPARLRLAVAVSVLGGALLVAGGSLGVVGDQPPSGFTSGPLLVALAVLAPLLAIGFLAGGRPATAAGVLVGSAMLAPGRALIDLQLAVDALLASRPELLVPASLTPLAPAAGVWLLLSGHIAMAAAGVLAAGQAGAAYGSRYAEEFDDPAGQPTAARRRSIGWAVGFGTLAALGLLMPQFRSGNAFLLAPDVFGAPASVRIGVLLVATALVAGAAFAASSMPARVTQGVLGGLLVAVAGVTAPPIVAGLSMPRVHPAVGPYLALGSVAVLVLVVYLLPGVRTPDRVDSRGGTPAEHPAEHSDGGIELRLEPNRLHLVAGVLGVLTGLAALGGAFGQQLVVDAGIPEPASYANRQLVPAGLLVGVLGGALLVPRWAPAFRPAFAVSLAAVPLAAASALDAAFTGAGVSAAVRVGVGVWCTGIALLLAVAAAVAAAIAGGAERDDVDLTEHERNWTLAIPLAGVVALGVGAFGMPAMRAPGYVAPGIWSDFRLASWGLLIGFAVLTIACVLAPLSRPAPAAALLLGAAGMVGVRLLELPLTGDRVAHPTAAQGTWLALACVAVLVAAAVMAVTTQRSVRRRPSAR